MNRPSQLRQIALLAVAAATMTGAFLAGRATRLPQVPAGGSDFQATDHRRITDARPSQGQQSWEDAWTLPTAAQRTTAVLDQLDHCRSSDDFRNAITTILARADKTEKTRHLALLFSAWLDRDPLAALTEVRRIEPLRHDASRVGTAFATWASKHPLEAADLLRQTLDGRQRQPASKPPFLDGIDPPEFLLSVVQGLGLANPSLAAETLARAADSPARNDGIAVLLQDWYPAAPESVRSWAAAIADPATRRMALAATAAKAGQVDDPGPAIEWARNLPSPSEQKIALELLTDQWSQRHSADSFAWVAALPDGDLKFSLMPAVLSQFVIIDPGAAADWLNRYDAAPALDASVAAYAKAIQFTNPTAAIGSAAAITDLQQRHSLILRLARSWLTRDPATATRAITESPLIPSEIRPQLMDPPH